MREPENLVTSGPVPPFRVIAIAQTLERIDDLISIADRFGELPLAVMLRDPEHDRARTEMLVEYARAREWPRSTTLIANSVSVEGVEWTHRTSRQLSTDSTGRIDGFDPEAKAGAGKYGYSVHSREEANVAVALGAVYLMFSTLFATRSKPFCTPTGTDALARLCAAVPIPVFALGGIRASNIRSCLDAGAYGVASITLFDPENRSQLSPALQPFDLL